MSQQTLFDKTLFEGPFDVGLIAASEIANNSEFNSIRVFMEFEDFDPSPTACNLTAILEEEVAPGVFEAVARTNELINSSDNSPLRHIVITPGFISNPAIDEFIPIGLGLRVSAFDGVAARSMRLAIYKANDCGNAPLQQFRLTARCSLFNR